MNNTTTSNSAPLMLIARISKTLELAAEREGMPISRMEPTLETMTSVVVARLTVGWGPQGNVDALGRRIESMIADLGDAVTVIVGDHTIRLVVRFAAPRAEAA